MRSWKPNPVLLTLLVIAFGLFIAVTIGPPAGVDMTQAPAVSTYTVVTVTDALAEAPHEPSRPRAGVAGPGLAILFALILLGALAAGARRCRSRDDGPPGAAFGITLADRCLLN